MRADEVKKLLLIKAIETSGHAPIHKSMLVQADRDARADAEPNHDPERYLVIRAGRLCQLMQKEHGLLTRLSEPTHLGVTLTAAVFLVVLIIGLSLNELSPGRTINILSAPILVLIVWNIVVCLASLLLLLRRKRAVWHPPGLQSVENFLYRTYVKILQRWSHRPERDRAVSDTVAAYLKEWLSASQPVFKVYLHLLLHGAAVALVIGAVSGMYARGIAFEYRATWESTFLNAEQVHTVLNVALGPASVVLQNPVPQPVELEVLRHTPGNAAPWIHRYAVTCVLFVILPRLLLVSIQLPTLYRLKRRFPLDWPTDPYFQDLLAADRGEGVAVEFRPFCHTLSGDCRSKVQDRLHRIVGGQAEVRELKPMRYGEELDLIEHLESHHGPPGITNSTALLFNFWQTPEPEVHGELVAAIKKSTYPPHQLIILIDDTGQTQQPLPPAASESAQQKRRDAWSAVLEQYKVEPVFLTVEP